MFIIPNRKWSSDYDWNEFLYFEFGYSVGGSLVFWFTIMYGLGTLTSEGIFCVAFLKIHTKSDYNCSYRHYSHWVYAFYECRLHFTKEYYFTEYHRFPDLLFTGGIQYDDDCHVK